MDAHYFEKCLRMKRKSSRVFKKDHRIYIFNASICSKILKKVLQMTTNMHASLIHVLLGLHEGNCYKKVKKSATILF